MDIWTYRAAVTTLGLGGPLSSLERFPTNIYIYILKLNFPNFSTFSFNERFFKTYEYDIEEKTFKTTGYEKPLIDSGNIVGGSDACQVCTMYLDFKL